MPSLPRVQQVLVGKGPH